MDESNYGIIGRKFGNLLPVRRWNIWIVYSFLSLYLVWIKIILVRKTWLLLPVNRHAFGFAGI